MKKIVSFLSIWLLLLTVLACQNIREPTQSDAVSNRGIRTNEEVTAVAKHALQGLPRTSISRAVEPQFTLRPVLSTPNARNTSDTLFYFVKDEISGGAVIVSARTTDIPVLGIMESCDLNEDEMEKVGNFQFVMDLTKQFVESGAAQAFAVRPPDPDPNPGYPFIPIIRYDTIATLNYNGHHIHVKWNQGWPENKYCPNHYAGCGPVAIAQVLSFFKPQMTMSLTFNGHPRESLNVYWDELVKHTVSSPTIYSPSENWTTTHITGCSGSENAHDDLGLLLRQIGQNVYASYDTNGTSTYPSDVTSYLNAVLSSKERHSYSSYDGHMYDHFAAPKTVGVVYGWTKDEQHGHGWVADGTLQIKTYVSYYEKEVIQWSKLDRVDNYIHFNWGWGGKYNGFFLEGVFKATTPDRPDIGLSRAGYDYNYKVKYATYK